MSTTTPTAADFAEAFPPYPVDWKALANPPSEFLATALLVGEIYWPMQCSALKWQVAVWAQMAEHLPDLRFPSPLSSDRRA